MYLSKIKCPDKNLGVIDSNMKFLKDIIFYQKTPSNDLFTVIKQKDKAYIDAYAYTVYYNNDMDTYYTIE